MTMIDDHIEEITRTIWATLLDLSIERAAHDGVGGDFVVTGCVQVEGAWNGAVMLRCPYALAATLAAAMFRAQGTPDEDEVRDAIGEITNMMAGNVKALLPEPSRISLPAVAFGTHYQLSVMGTAPAATVAFTCDGHPLVVTLVRQLDGR